MIAVRLTKFELRVIRHALEFWLYEGAPNKCGDKEHLDTSAETARAAAGERLSGWIAERLRA